VFLIKSTYNLRSEKDGFELMRAALPHLRLLTLELDQISLLTKYLTAEEKTFLAGELFFKEGTTPNPAPSSLSTNKSPRRKSLVELIPENLIVKETSDQDLDTLHATNSTKFQCQIINADRDFILRGVEILTQAKIIPDSTNNAKKAKYAFLHLLNMYLLIFFLRFEAEEEYKEIIKVLVFGGKNLLFDGLIFDMKQFNSWFYYAFDKDIKIRKGEKCIIVVIPRTGAKYIKIGENQVKENLQAAKCSAEKAEKLESPTPGVWSKCETQNYIVKSLYLKLI